MKFRKVIQKHIRHSSDGIHVAGAIQAAVSANVNEPGETRTNVESHTRIVQRDGRTEVFETKSQPDPEEGTK